MVRPDVMEQDWDTLIVLDACRYDLFAWYHGNFVDVGETEMQISRGSSTAEFVEYNFTDPPYEDTVYVSANPTVDRIASVDDFYMMVPAWMENWNDEYSTVPPRAFTEAVIEAHHDFPNKRIIAHYLQPHLPFVGDLCRDYGKSDEIKQYMVGTQGLDDGFDADEDSAYDPEGPVGIPTPVMLRWRTGYFENLQLVVALAFSLAAGTIANVDGKFAITSDHGELIGEVGEVPAVGHEHGNDHPALREVPWAVVEGERRDVSADDQIEQEPIDDAAMKPRLRALGYLE